MLLPLLLLLGGRPDDPVPTPLPAVPVLAVVDPVVPPPSPMPGPATSLDLPAGRFEILQIRGYTGKSAPRWRSSSPVVTVTGLKAKTRVEFRGPTPPLVTTVTGGGPTVVLATGLKAGAVGPSTHVIDDSGPAVLVAPVGSGEATVEADGTDADGNIVTLLSVRVRAGLGPIPPPKPVDPDPPAPKPVDPTDPSPFPDPGFRVLMVYDANNTLRPAAQNSVLYGKTVRDYLKARCVTEGDNGDPNTAGKGFRIYTASADVSQAPKVWQDAFRLASSKGKDWILIGDGKKGYSGPLPRDEAEAMTLLQKYGGQ